MSLVKAAGRHGPEGIVAEDIARNPELHEQFKAYSLRDYFDQDGRRKFQNLSLTYAARHQKNLKLQFGSTSDAHLRPAHLEHASFSARAYHLATEAIARDKELIAARGISEQESLTAEDKVRQEDVRNRQTEFLFLEVPEPHKYLPPGVTLDQILPPDLSPEEEQKQKWKDERLNSSLDQLLESSTTVGGVRNDWLLSMQEIAELMKWIQLWNSAARGHNIPQGMCRPTFCQFLFDAGLVGTKEVPYHWAVSLFDAHANPSRCCPQESSQYSTAPFTKSVNRWNLVGVIDRIMRQYCDIYTKKEFFKKVIGRLRDKIPSQYCHPREIKKVTGTAQTNARGSIIVSRRSITMEEEDGDDGASKVSEKRKSVVSAASAASSQPWLKPPERPLSSVDTGREHLKRDRLVSSMIKEPDVLHLMKKYKPMFKSLFDCYAKDGKMAFPEFLQFAVNFRFMPRVASTYVLQYMYDSVVCTEEREVIEYRKQKKEKEKRASMPRDLKSPRSARKGDKGTPRQRQSRKGPGEKGPNRLSVEPTGKQRGTFKANDGEEPKTPNPTPRSPPKKKGTNGSGDSTGSKDSVPSTPSLDGKIPSTPSTQCPDSNSSSEKRDSASSLLTVTTERLSIDDSIAEDAVSVAGSEDSEWDTIEVRHKEQVFGVNAFAEAILKVSFSYLCFYGNTVQANCCSFAKAVWVITYIHCMYDHFQQSRTRHAAEAENGDSSRRQSRTLSRRHSSKSGPADIVPPNPFAPKPEALENNVNKGMEQNLKKVLDQVDPQIFITPPRSEIEFTFPNLEPKPGPGVLDDDKSKSLKRGDVADAEAKLKRRKVRKHASGDDASELASPTATDIEAKRPDYEEPAVVHGLCRVCDKELLANDWGNAQCHGCSAVDSLGLRTMPLHKLLELGEDEDSEKKKVEKKPEQTNSLLESNASIKDNRPVLEVRLPAGVRPLALNMNMQLSPPPTGDVRQLLMLS